MKRYTHITSGARVSVRDDKVMDSSWVPDTGSESSPAAEGYEAMKVADLKAEIERRNADRDEADRVSSEGRKPDLIAALQADDER
ncbi:SAP domain-containing protein [Micromonospora sp. NPDC047753]|uniref:SAP domain-containing protein n=1 Tax=Micromonospora sp. NPDC047753 TaxID=3154817 RepID=UPI003410FD17